MLLLFCGLCRWRAIGMRGDVKSESREHWGRRGGWGVRRAIYLSEIGRRRGLIYENRWRQERSLCRFETLRLSSSERRCLFHIHLPSLQSDSICVRCDISERLHPWWESRRRQDAHWVFRPHALLFVCGDATSKSRTIRNSVRSSIEILNKRTGPAVPARGTIK